VTTHLRESALVDGDGEQPRSIVANPSLSDRVFRFSVRSTGLLVLVLTGSIGLFLGYQLIPTLHRYGLGFFTNQQFEPEQNIVGISSAIVGSVEIALITLVISFPLALLSALYVSEYAPGWARSFLISVIDLMAAVPSIVYGVWGVFLLQPHALFVARWLAEWFGWIPIFKVTDANPRDPAFPQYRYEQSAFTAGLVVAMMVIPLACAVMRNVFSQAPVGEREAALALGSTRWGMIRAVVLPFGRGGIIGATMLGLGRALGETVAVLLVVSLNFGLKIRILENGTVTISSLIANSFGEATAGQLSALLAAGFVLFVMTLAVNTGAAVIVNRSRSGAGLDG
jgi:phosphate transport system permease protein